MYMKGVCKLYAQSRLQMTMICSHVIEYGSGYIHVCINEAKSVELKFNTGRRADPANAGTIQQRNE
jgi:hypothetical protein